MRSAAANRHHSRAAIDDSGGACPTEFDNFSRRWLEVLATPTLDGRTLLAVSEGVIYQAVNALWVNI